jgi:hypothetical protein
MRFMSPYADKEINLPDEKVPDVDTFSLKCPYTGKKIIVRKDGDGVNVQAAEPMAEEPLPRQESPAEELPSVEPDVVPPGSKVAFIFSRQDAWTKAAEKFAETAGYYVSTAEDVLTSVAKLRLNNYDLIFVEEGGDSERIISEVNSWLGLKRRAANFILLGDDGDSMQPHVAFDKGANFYFNKADAGRAEQLFKEAEDGYALYYRPLQEAEKKVFGLTE